MLHLRFARHDQLDVPRSRLTTINARRSFVYAAAAATWNSLPVPDSLKYTRPTCFQNHLKKFSSLVYFLADRTNGRAIGTCTVLRLSSSV